MKIEEEEVGKENRMNSGNKSGKMEKTNNP